MTEEKLPIRFFLKRQADNLRIEPGGGKVLPNFVLEKENLINKTTSIKNSFKLIEKEVRDKEEKESIIPVVITAKIIDDARAKTHRREVSKLFNVSKDSRVIGLGEIDQLVIKLDNSDDTNRIIEKIDNYENNSYAISCIDTVSIFDPIIMKSSEMHSDDYKVKLINYQDDSKNSAIRNYFERVLTQLGYKLKKTYYSDNHLVYKINSVDFDGLQIIKEHDVFDSVFSFEPMPKYTVSLDMEDFQESIPILSPDQNRDYSVVGILDSGVSKIPHLEPWLLDDSHSSYPEDLINRKHGTFVSGIVTYGDQLEEQTWVGNRGVRLFDACVIPDSNQEEIQEDELIRNIQEAINAYHKLVKVWNLSISITEEIDNTCFSDFAVALDDIQDKYGVLICKSAGNCINFLNGIPKGRIHLGADSVRSIVVGSIAHKKSDFDFAEIDNPSPFSRIGRGPSHIIKPELVHYGGNAGKDKNDNPCHTGVKSFGLNGSFNEAVGTSFSTPRVSALAAGLCQEMEEEFDPLLIKALAVHSASYPDNLSIPNEERINQMGFGKPKSINRILYNTSDEITLILRDKISKGEYVDIMDFPMPDCMIEDGFYTGQIIVTLVYNPILDATQRAEYCQSNIDIKLGTYSDKKEKDTERPNILNPVGREGSQNLLLKSIYSKRKIMNNFDDFALKERLLIQYKDKYYPVKKYAVNLSEMTEKKRDRLLNSDRKWYLYIKGLFRHHVEEQHIQDLSSLSQEFCLIVTIKDSTGTKQVYTSTIQKLDEYNFLNNNIKLHSEVEVRI